MDASRSRSDSLCFLGLRFFFGSIYFSIRYFIFFFFVIGGVSSRYDILCHPTKCSYIILNVSMFQFSLVILGQFVRFFTRKRR
jgi:hypothetical protein